MLQAGGLGDRDQPGARGAARLDVLAPVHRVDVGAALFLAIGLHRVHQHARRAGA